MGLEFEKLCQANVLVVGDVMVDKFVYGDVRRISPEAPIPILTIHNERSMAGGAANVALNVAALGARVVVTGIAGDDAAGQELLELLNGGSWPVETEIVVVEGRPTTLKTRYISNRHQILRVDQECAEPASSCVEDRLIERIKRQIDRADVIALSDYAKGVLTDRVISEVIALASAAGLPVVVDPKRARWNVYRGASVIKPNLQELVVAAGLDTMNPQEVDCAATRVAEEFGVSLLLTRSQDGMSLYQTGKPAVHATAATHEVFDVSGAGDTALAAFSATLASGGDLEQSMQIANLAAGVAVTKFGTAIVTADELKQAWTDSLIRGPVDRLASIEVAAAIAHYWKSRGLIVGFTNGCFDIVHAGHVSMLAAAAGHCDRLIVGLNSDDSVRRLKGPSRPVQQEASRAKVMAAIASVSLVTVFDTDTPIELIKQIKPDVIFKGADYTQDQVVGGDLVKSWGGRVVLIDLIPEMSTTRTIRRAIGSN